MDDVKASGEMLRKSNKAFFSLNFSFGLWVLTLVLNGILKTLGLQPIWFFVLIIPALLFYLTSVYRIAVLLRKNNEDKTSPGLWVIGMLLPVINFVLLIVLYFKTIKMLKTLEAAQHL